MTTGRNVCDNVLFEIGFDWFMKRLNSENRKILRLRLENYKQHEIADMIGLTTSTVCRRLRKIGKKLIDYFNLPHSYIETYGLA